MAQLKYNGNVVNSTVSQLNNISNNWNSLIDEMKNATDIIVSSKGFDKYIGRIKSDSFSSLVSNCQTFNNDLINLIRQMQIEILSYSQDNNDIQAFLDELDLKDYKNLNMKPIEEHILFGRKASNIFKGFTSSLATSVLGVLEGIGNFGETGADLVVLGKSAVSSIFTGAYDFVTGSDTTKKMWEDTKAFVSEKHVENAFNKFYDNTEFGQNIKNNAYGFDNVRSIANGIGYSSGIILTGGLATGVGLGSATTSLATTAGLMGFSGGTEEAWADGASIEKGLLYGVATGAWEGTQWAIGSGINNIYKSSNGFASNVFKGGLRGLTTRTALESADAGIEGIVQPGLKMIYKDYEGNTLAEKYKNAFNDAGGWQNVRNQAILGGIMSSGSEFLEASAGYLFKSKSDRLYDDKSLNKLFDESDDASRIFLSKFSEVDSARYDSLFLDLDNSTRSYGIDQGVFDSMRLVEYKRLNNDWFNNDEQILSDVFNNMNGGNVDVEVLNACVQLLLTKDKISSYARDALINYISLSTDSYDEALQIFNSSFSTIKNTEFDSLINKYVDMGLSFEETVDYFNRINKTGACSYASCANAIVSYFSDKPDLFKSKFGFDLYKQVNGEKVINSHELLADFYTFINNKSNNPDAELFDFENNKLVIKSDNSNDQVYMSGFDFFEGEMLEKYLKSKSPDMKLDFVHDRYAPYLDFLYDREPITKVGVYNKIKSSLDEDKFILLGLSREKDKKFSFYNPNGEIHCTTNTWNEGGGHSVFVTDITETDVVVSSWGRKLLIPLEEFVDNRFTISTLKLNESE